MNDYYECSTCGRKFKFRSKRNTHERQAHNSKITDHVDSKELKRLEGMSKALRRNNYDKNNSTTDESKQRTLRNRKVRKKKLNDFTT